MKQIERWHCVVYVLLLFLSLVSDVFGHGQLPNKVHQVKLPQIEQSSADALKTHKPHIIFIVVDDVGFGDSVNKLPQTETPAIDDLIRQGVALTNYYVLPSCSPSRAAFMTGRYPIRYGLNKVLETFKPEGVPLTETFLPQTLRAAGYRTHAIGKWRLGFHRWEYTPTFRGFESFHGSYSGEEKHHDLHEALTNNCGPDCSKVVDHHTNYSIEYLASVATSVIKDHNPSEPLFMYLVIQDTSERYLAQHETNTKNEALQIHAGMLDAMDQAVYKVTQQLLINDMYNNTLFVYTSDKGCPTATCGRQGSSNSTLRGGKGSIWEGGTRSFAFISGAGIPQHLVGQTYSGLMHAVDWLPTLAHVAGASLAGHLPLDGINQWHAITAIDKTVQCPREEIFYGLGNDMRSNGAAIRHGNWKLIVGNPGGELWPTKPGVTAHQGLEVSELPHGWKRMAALYQVDDDPQELKDMMDEEPEIAAGLKDRLRAYLSIHSMHAEDAVDIFCQHSIPFTDGGFVPWCHEVALSVLSRTSTGDDPHRWFSTSTSTTSTSTSTKVRQSAQDQVWHGSVDPMLCKLQAHLNSSAYLFTNVFAPTNIFSRRVRKCAVVGSSGVLKLHNHGNRIDTADMVIRFNVAPILGFQEHVGSKDDIRVVNEKVLDDWHTGYDQRVLKDDTIYLSTCAVCDIFGSFSTVDDNEFKERQRRLLKDFPSLKLFGSDLRFEAALREFFKKFYGVGFTDAGVTTGTVGMVLALNMCDEVFAYGMAASSNDVNNTYSYWEGSSSKVGKMDTTKDTTQHWHPSFEHEKKLWRQVAVNSAHEIDSTDVAIIPGFGHFECT